MMLIKSDVKFAALFGGGGLLAIESRADAGTLLGNWNTSIVESLTINETPDPDTLAAVADQVASNDFAQATEANQPKAPATQFAGALFDDPAHFIALPDGVFEGMFDGGRHLFHIFSSDDDGPAFQRVIHKVVGGYEWRLYKGETIDETYNFGQRFDGGGSDDAAFDFEFPNINTVAILGIYYNNDNPANVPKITHNGAAVSLTQTSTPTGTTPLRDGNAELMISKDVPINYWKGVWKETLLYDGEVAGASLTGLVDLLKSDWSIS